MTTHADPVPDDPHRAEARDLTDAKLRRLHSCAAWWAANPPPDRHGPLRLPPWALAFWPLRDRPVLDQLDALGAELRRRGLEAIAPHRQGEPAASGPPSA